MGGIGLFVVAKCVYGVMAFKKFEANGSKAMIKIYFYLLIAFAAVNGLVFMAVGYIMTNIDERMDKDWHHFEDAATKRGITKESFVENAESGFRMIMTFGAIIVGMQGGVLYCCKFILKGEGTSCTRCVSWSPHGAL